MLVEHRRCDHDGQCVPRACFGKCVLPVLACGLPIQPVLNHGPRSLTCVQVNGTNFGEGVIIGVLDTGITPNHPSFDGKDMPPPPAKWKGKCEFTGTACNNKLISARNFIGGGTRPPVDDEGHVTHTASTAAGNFVSGAGVFGMANGTTVGIAPRAHLAMYKVCDEACFETDILAAMDAAH